MAEPTRTARPLPARLLVGFLLGVAVVGCVADPPTITPAPPTPDMRARITPEPGTATFRMDPTNTELAVGFERFAFRLFDATGGEIIDGSVTAVFYTINEALKESVRKASGEALYFGGDIPGGRRWVVYTDFDVSGPWSLDVTATLPNGESGLATANIIVEGRTASPSVGRPVPDADTPHVADGVALADLTTDPDPDEQLYAMSVADAIATQLPTVVLFASPAHCAEEGCAATLAALRQVAAQYQRRVNFIHIESRDPASPEQLSAAAQAWNLHVDPWTFFLNGRGLVSGRIEGPVGADEIKLMVERTLKSP